MVNKKLIKCDACEKEISKQADKCPECGHPLKRVEVKIKETLVGIGILVVFIALFWLWLSPSDKTDEEKQAQENARIAREIEGNLVFACSNEIKKTLKYPSSYSQPWTDIMEVVKKGEQNYLIRIPFDAKNAFGNEVPQVGYCTSDGVNTTLVQVDNR